MYLNASVHCLFCHPHSDGSLGNRNERELDADDINKDTTLQPPPWKLHKNGGMTQTRHDKLKTI